MYVLSEVKSIDFLPWHTALDNVDIKHTFVSIESAVEWEMTFVCIRACNIESVQDFLIKLDIKPLMHLLEISTFSLNNVIVRLTKIMNRADKN